MYKIGESVMLGLEIIHSPGLQFRPMSTVAYLTRTTPHHHLCLLVGSSCRMNESTRMKREAQQRLC